MSGQASGRLHRGFSGSEAERADSAGCRDLFGGSWQADGSEGLVVPSSRGCYTDFDRAGRGRLARPGGLESVAGVGAAVGAGSSDCGSHSVGTVAPLNAVQR
jgi:hypothetical protein